MKHPIHEFSPTKKLERMKELKNNIELTFHSLKIVCVPAEIQTGLLTNCHSFSQFVRW
jgi:hypothetical protein